MKWSGDHSLLLARRSDGVMDAGDDAENETYVFWRMLCSRMTNRAYDSTKKLLRVDRVGIAPSAASMLLHSKYAVPADSNCDLAPHDAVSLRDNTLLCSNKTNATEVSRYL